MFLSDWFLISEAAEFFLFLSDRVAQGEAAGRIEV
jgi:hypothetical protein